MTIRSMPAESTILLESGTNEVEVLVFRVGQLSLGINVAKVREILTVPKMTQLPDAHSSMFGCFQLRDVVVPCLSLHRHLQETRTSESHESVVILAEFNQYQLGFVVDVVERIHRISWNQVLPVPSIISHSNAPVTSITQIDNRLITMLDFEAIASQLTNRDIEHHVVENTLNVARTEKRIAIADDSPTARHALETTLSESGYTSLFVFENGADLWEWLSSHNSSIEEGNPVDLVITDVEMPVTDGFHLTRRIKEHPQYGNIPVLLYSSILTPDNLKKGEAVRADAQITKPELNRVVHVADELIHKAAKPRNREKQLSAC